MEDSTFHGDCRGHDETRVHIGEVRPFPGIDPDKEMALKPLEEAAEIYAAWQNCSPNALAGWCSFNGSELAARQKLFNEVADCIQACADLAYAMGCDDLAPYMAACEQGNRERGRYEDKR